jgi:hypothetical protein
MSTPRKDYSPVENGFVRIERRSDGLHDVTVLRDPDSDSKSDIVCVHLRIQRIDMDRNVRTVSAGAATRSVAPVTVYQSFKTKTVVITPAEN